VTDASAALGRRLHADRFHTGVRVVTLLMWLVAIVAAYIVLGLLAAKISIPITGLGVLLLLIAAIVVAQPLAWWGERQLIAHWPSGRAVQLEPGALVWHDHGPTSRFDLGQKVNYWRWRFAVGRRRSGRIPGNHHCFAIRLVQGDTVLTLYTFLSPAAADSLTARYPFYELRRPNDPAKTALGGRDAIYLAAEHTRWDEGAEFEAGDFEALVGHLAVYLSEFPRSAQSGV
jgi:hypothetical protein